MQIRTIVIPPHTMQEIAPGLRVGAGDDPTTVEVRSAWLGDLVRDVVSGHPCVIIRVTASLVEGPAFEVRDTVDGTVRWLSEKEMSVTEFGWLERRSREADEEPVIDEASASPGVPVNP